MAKRKHFDAYLIAEALEFDYKLTLKTLGKYRELFVEYHDGFSLHEGDNGEVGWVRDWDSSLDYSIPTIKTKRIIAFIVLKKGYCLPPVFQAFQLLKKEVNTYIHGFHALKREFNTAFAVIKKDF